MNWSQIQKELQSIARRIRQNKVLDAATVGLLGEVPVVGGFLTRYWDNLTAGDESPQIMASFIEAIAEQEHTFNNLCRLVETQGEQLISQGRTLGEILLRVDETRDDIRGIKLQISRFVETLRIPSARAAFELAAAMGEDYRQSRDRIQQAQQVLQHAGAEADARSYYQLGVVYLSMSEFEHAEASLLKALEMQPDLVDALIGLAMIYQRRATEHLRQDNFGLAEDAAIKSEGYVKSAMLHDPTDVSLQMHLGYLYKDLAQRYGGTGKAAQSQNAADKARGCFETVLKITPENASAHNGLGSLCLIRHDYDCAIEHCSKAIELMPDYLFAHFDLAQACYLKAMDTQPELPRLQAMKQGLEAYIKVVELDGADGQDSLPPHARQAIDQMYQQVLAQINQLDVPSGPGPGQVQPPPGGREGAQRRASDVVVRVLPQFLSLVIAESSPDMAMFNLNCDIVNEGPAPVSIRRLEAGLTTPEGLQLRFTWSLFYDFSPSYLPESKTMTKTDDAHEIEIAAQEGVSLGVQFVGPALGPRHLWTPGEYRVELYGWVDRPPGPDDFNLKTSFRVEIGTFETGRVRRWSTATKTEWDQLRDPDRAVGIPVMIDGSSIVVA